MDIVLASKSPRRRELMSLLGIEKFEVIPAEGEEYAHPALSPGETVCELARCKASEVSARCGDGRLIIAADTLVYLDDIRLGKPKDKEDAFRMLKMLSGKKHTVYTGVSLMKAGAELTEFEASDVYFADLSDEEINAYIATGEPMDKAGAYGAQGRGAVFIDKIDGDFFNVMGLPVRRLYKMMKNFGVTV